MRVRVDRDLLVCLFVDRSIGTEQSVLTMTRIGSCTCEKVEKVDAAVQEGLETDFTTKA